MVHPGIAQQSISRVKRFKVSITRQIPPGVMASIMPFHENILSK